MANIINIQDRKADRELSAILGEIADLERRMQAAVDSGLFVSASNDNHSDLLNTGISSVAVARVGGSWVVSHFLCGADGEADVDAGEIQVTTCQSEGHARQLFASICLVARSHTSRLAKMRKAMLRGKR